MTGTDGRRAPISVVCVYNNQDVLANCLQRSVEAGLKDSPATELIAVDNRTGVFASAGAALNHGARSAQHDVVVFVHQDVVLHSLPTLEIAAARLLSNPALGMIGAVGIDSRGTIVGRMRDRVVRVGVPSPMPTDVDSLDEVLLMVSRERVMRDPISEDPLLAWHAYGVEYACRVRAAGDRAVACDLAITHNSLTVNLARLDEAHERVGRLYPQLLPVQTTCGTIRSEKGPRYVRQVIRKLSSAGRWWRESRVASSMSGAGPVVLVDIRQCVDEAVRLAGLESLTVLDCNVGSAGPPGVNHLIRFEFPFTIEVVSESEVRDRISARAVDEALLIVGSQPATFASLGLDSYPRTVGYSHDIGGWALIGVDHVALAPLLARRRSKPYAGLVPVPREVR